MNIEFLTNIMRHKVHYSVLVLRLMNDKDRMIVIALIAFLRTHLQSSFVFFFTWFRRPLAVTVASPDN